MNREEAVQSAMCYRTLEMLDLLVEETGLPEGLCEAVLGVWMGMIRSLVLANAEQDGRYLIHLEQGRVVIITFIRLARSDRERASVIGYFSRETGASRSEVQRVLRCMFSQLRLLCGGKAFEPIGWVEDSGDDTYLVIRLWPNFLQPKIDAPIELITG